MANFTIGLAGPWRPRRELLKLSTRALADQGARVSSSLLQALERTDIDKRPTNALVRIRIDFTGPEAPDDLIDLVDGVAPYVLEMLVRRGLFARAQISEFAAAYMGRTELDGFLLTVIERAPAAG